MTIQRDTEITLGRYVFERLRQLGIGTIYGLPGDFNLALLDHIYEVDGLRWAGNANELNAAYAADGYSRVNGLSCLITTFGVGELSALNGIAGAYAEHVGLIHIVGVPSIKATADKLLLHHTLGNGDFDAFRQMSKKVSYATTLIDDIYTAPAEFDRLFREAYVQKRPVYIGLPTNFVEMTVPAALLETPISLALPKNEPQAEEEVVTRITELVHKAENPIILVDACALRHDSQELVAKLADITQFPIFATPMGKSGIDETHPRFGGIYVGVLSAPDVKDAVENSDLILSVGGLLSDFNTGSFSYQYHTKNVVEFHSDHCKIRTASYPGIQMQFVLEKLVKVLPPVLTKYVPAPLPTSPYAYKSLTHDPASPLTQQWLWQRLSTFLREGDIIISETGTSAFGIIQAHFPKNAIGISQVLYGSIGYTVGACLGAVMAAQEKYPDRRVLLFIGDGSLQLTVQEISTMCRWGCNPYLFILNNNGYTIERLIHGPVAQYNEIQPWDHSLLLPLFGGAHKWENKRIATVGEADAAFDDADFQTPNKIRMIEVMLPVMDAPSNLVKQAEITAQTNAAA